MVRLWSAIALASLVLIGCGGDSGPASPRSGGERGSSYAPVSTRVTTDAILAALREKGAEVGKTHAMEPDDYGLAPLVAAEGVRFLIPSLGEDSGGRVFTFANADDLHKLRKYYDDLGRDSAAFFSWTFANEAKLAPVQINGDLPKAKAETYRAAIEGL
jgi:hypothetical protein